LCEATYPSVRKVTRDSRLPYAVLKAIAHSLLFISLKLFKVNSASVEFGYELDVRDNGALRRLHPNSMGAYMGTGVRGCPRSSP
jgi:hypothetical protein